MKPCKECGDEITNGVNGYMLSDSCFTCGGWPNYYAKPTSINDNSDYEGAILAANESDD